MDLPANVNEDLSKHRKVLDPVKRKGLYNQLTLILHANKCLRQIALILLFQNTFISNDNENNNDHHDGDVDDSWYQCDVKMCPRMRKVLRHIQNSKCKSDDCGVKGCKSTRQLTNHWRHCNDQDCPVCAPIRQLVPLKRPVLEEFKNGNEVHSRMAMELFGPNVRQWEMSDEKREEIRKKMLSNLVSGTLAEIGDLTKYRQLVLNIETTNYNVCDSEQQYLRCLSDKIYRGRVELGRNSGFFADGKLNLNDENGKLFCSICHSHVLRNGCNLKQLPCGHVYHSTCVSQWLQMKSNCPMCRSDFANSAGFALAAKS